MNYLVRDREVIFNLAGQVSHIDSMRDPYTDLEINCRSQLTLLEACRNHNPAAKVVFAGTRQVYGKPDHLPVDETHLVRPTDINGINKVAGEYYHLVYNNVFGVRACSLRLTNIYGPRQLVRHNRQGFIGWFVRLVVEDKEIQIFGDGLQLRDFVYVDDAADAFLRAGATDAVNGQVFNVGGAQPISHLELVDAADRDRRHRRLPPGRVAAREEGHRHRQLLRRLDALPRRRPAGSRRRRCATGWRRRSRTIDEHLPALPGLIGRAAAAHASVPSRPVPVAAARRRSPGDRRRHRARPRSRLVHPRPRAAGVRTGARGRLRHRGRGRRRHRHRRAVADPARPRHRAGRRGDHDAAVGGLQRARDHGGRGAPGVRRHRSGAADARPARHRGRDHAAHARRSCRCTSTASRPTCRRSWRSRSGTAWRSIEDACQAHLATCDGRPVGIDGRRRRAQLLPDQEPRRARRRRRGADQRSPRSPTASGGCATAASRRATTTTSSA